jgi:hypothetical protein
MPMMRIVSRAVAVALVASTGCHSLDIQNPNEPDAERALSDPSAIEAVAGGAMRTWFNAYDGLKVAGVLSTQARTYSSSWNNGNMNFYSGLDADGTRKTRPWQNDPAAAARTSVEWFWSGSLDEAGIERPGYYAALSAANDALRAIRTNNVVIRNAADTKRTETIAVLMQGAALMGIALNYDKGFIVDETTDLSSLDYSNRKQLRDAAVAKLNEAITLAKANTFTTPASWTNGTSYTNSQIARIAATMAAMTLAYYPRDDAENATQVNWATVITYTSQGMSTGTPFDFVFTGDGCAAFCHEILAWFNAMDTGRLHTRVANMLDPATQTDPWPLAAGGNPQPHSLDKRLGDGSFGDASMIGGFGNIPKTANAGTDFAYSSQAVFRPDRGSYHQSNIAHIRYDLSGVQSPNGIYGGFGPAPVISAAQNDLLWAEALLRGGGSLTQAATLINNTRVTRGGLPPAAAGDGVAVLLTKLLYEKEIELLGLGAAPFYERRRVAGGLIVGTPREMPVPSKELGIKGEAVYTWGGTGPANSPTPP